MDPVTLGLVALAAVFIIFSIIKKVMKMMFIGAILVAAVVAYQILLHK